MDSSWQLLRVTGPTVVVSAGTSQLQLRAVDAMGNEVSVRGRWTSSDTTLATVDGNGRVTGKRVGDVRIEASVSTLRAGFALQVRPASMRLDLAGFTETDEAFVRAGTPITARVVFRDANGRDISTPWTLGWSVSDGRLAFVTPSDTGLRHEVAVTGLQPGNVILNVSGQGMGVKRELDVHQPDGTPLQIVVAQLLVQREPGELWLVAPRVIVRSLGRGVAVSRVRVEGQHTVCGYRVLERGVLAALFGSQPDGLAWISRNEPPEDRSKVRFEVTVHTSDGRVFVRGIVADVLHQAPGVAVDTEQRSAVWAACA